jgi:PAS domain S-box-containing protein
MEDPWPEPGPDSMRMFVQNPHPAWIYDHETLRILAANDAAVRRYGYARDEFLAMSMADLYPPGDPPGGAEAALRMEAGPGPGGSCRHRTKDGTLLHVEIIRHTMSYTGRRAHVMLAHDVSGHVRTASAHRESEERFRVISESIPLAMAITRLTDSRILYANERFLRTFGYSEKDYRQRTVADFVADPADKRTIRDALQRDGALVDRELQVRRVDGTTFWVSVSMRRMVYEGEPAVIGICSDVTERKRIEEGLVAAEAKFRGLVEQALVGTYIIQDGRFAYANPRMAEILGCTPRDLLAMRSALETVVESDRPLVSENLRRRVEGEVESLRYAFRCRRKDGTVIDVESHGARMEFNGRPAVIGTLLDVTERNRADEALHYRLRFENLVASLSTQFINLPLERIDEGIQEALRVVGEFADADRSYVFMLSPDRVTVDNTHEWCAAGIRSTRSELQGVRFEDFPWMAERMLRGEVVYVPRIGDLPEEAKTDRERLEREGGDWSLLLVPMTSRGEVVGFLGFDRLRMPPVWSDDTVMLLRVVGQILVNALERKRAEEALRYRVAFENLVASISAQFINLPPERIDEGVRGALRTVGEFCGADRGYVFMLSDDRRTVDKTHDWIGDGVAVLQTPFQGVDVETFPWIASRLLRGEVVHVPLVAALPPEAATLRQLLEQEGSRSLVAVPLIRQGTTVGFLGFDAVRREADWTADTISLLTLVGQIIVNALERKRAEEAIRLSEDRWRAIVENAPDIVLTVDAAGTILFINRTLPGIDQAAVIGRSQYDFMAPEHRARGREAVRRVFEEGISVRYEVATADRSRWFDSRVGPLRRHGKVEAAMIIATDVTESRRAEEAVRLSEEKWRTLVENAPDNIFTCDAEGKILFMNRVRPEFREISVVGTSIYDYIAPEHHARARGVLKQVFERGEPGQYEASIPVPGGEPIWFISHAGPVRRDGRVTEALLINLDITERRRAEEALRKGERFLSDMFSSIQDGISILDPDLRIVRVNSVMESWYGHAMPLVGKKCYEAYHGRSEPCEGCPSRQTLKTREKAYEVVPKTGPGGRVEGWLDLYTFPLVDAATGEMRGVIEYVRDITERRRAEEALRESTHHLEQAHQRLQENQAQLVQSEKMAALGLLAAGVAHEINNPVGFVMSNIGTLGDYVGVYKRLLEAYEALAEASTEADRKAALERIAAIRREEDLSYVQKDVDALLRESQDGANRVKEIIQALRSFARADEGEPVEVDLNAGIEATIKVVWNELKYKCRLTRRLGPVPRVTGYPGQLNQVFLNLILNAAQAIAEQGEITVETAAADGHAVVRVSDNGVGIPPENLSKLFTPFFTTKPVGKGTGLGLSISYNIVRKHRGTIDVRSEVGRGTTFTVRLPLAEEAHG